VAVNTVGKILESAGHLKVLMDGGASVALREVNDLREAFDCLHQHLEPYEYSKKSTRILDVSVWLLCDLCSKRGVAT